MSRSLIFSPAVAILALTSIVWAKEPQTLASPENLQIDSQKTDSTKEDLKKEVDEAEKKADEALKALKNPPTSKPPEKIPEKTPEKTIVPPAPTTSPTIPKPEPERVPLQNSAPAASSTSSSPEPSLPEPSLKKQYTEEKSQSFENLELALAKEKAISRTSNTLLIEAENLQKLEATKLSPFLGPLFKSKGKENYYIETKNLKKGEFEVSLLQDSYLGFKKDGVCIISTKTSIITSTESELTPPTATISTIDPTEQIESAAQIASIPPKQSAVINCFRHRENIFHFLDQ